MSEASQDCSLRKSVNRLLQFRIPLFALLLCNVGVVLLAPALQSQRGAVSAASGPVRSDIKSLKHPNQLQNTEKQKTPEEQKTPQIVDTNQEYHDQTLKTQSASVAPSTSFVETGSKSKHNNKQEMSIEQILKTLSDDGTNEDRQEAKDDEIAKASSTVARQHVETPHQIEPPQQVESPQQIDVTDIKLPNVMGPLARLQQTISSLSKEAAAIESAAASEGVNAEIVLTNPPENGGQVCYLVDDQQFSLQPGESQKLSADRVYHIQFHRGGDLGDVAYWVPGGSYRFAVDESGWELHPDSL